MRAFTVYVRLEYITCAFCPISDGGGQIKQVETVQRRFAKRLPGHT